MPRTRAGHRTESLTSPRRIEAVNKQRMALELRMAGQTYQQIAVALEYKSHTGALAAVQAALKKTLAEPSERYRALTLERLTKVLSVWWPLMLKADPVATDRCFRAIKGIRELLGLDAPIRVEGRDGGAILMDLRAVLVREIDTISNRLALGPVVEGEIVKEEPHTET